MREAMFLKHGHSPQARAGGWSAVASANWASKLLPNKHKLEPEMAGLVGVLC